MNTFVALLRGINVGGHNKLPMAELRRQLAELGLESVRTYIQSGNVVFDAAGDDAGTLGDTIRSAIESAHGFAPQVLVLSADRFRAALADNPFPEAVAEPKTLHFAFLAGPADAPELERLEAVREDNERFELRGLTFYLHAPDGIGRSRLAERIERALGVPCTMRNARTVGRLAEMLDG